MHATMAVKVGLTRPSAGESITPHVIRISVYKERRLAAYKAGISGSESGNEFGQFPRTASSEVASHCHYNYYYYY
jgi:hypothetical protein